MDQFFNKNELVMIVFAVLILSIGVSSGEFINYIFYKEKSGLVAYVFVLASLLIDIYIFDMVTMSTSTDSTQTNNNDIIDKKLIEGTRYKMRMFIIFVLLAIVLSVLIMPTVIYNDTQTNTLGVRMLRSVPLLLIVVYLLYRNTDIVTNNQAQVQVSQGEIVREKGPKKDFDLLDVAHLLD